MLGWIKLYRRIREHPFWPVNRAYSKLEAWIDLLFSANHKPTSINLDFITIKVGRGQFITSQIKLAKKWGWHRERVFKFLRLLKSEGMADFETSNRTSTGYTLITILNYEKYQGADIDETSSRTDSAIFEYRENLDTETTSRADSQKSDETLDLLSGSRLDESTQPAAKPATAPAAARQPSGTNKNDKNEKKTYPASDTFDLAWGIYPKRAGGNSKTEALKAWTARIRAGENPAEMLAGTRRYAEFIRATGKERTEYVKQAATFFGPNEHWKEAWNVPAEKLQHSGGFVG
jgi:hypothetical protein